MPRTDGRVEPGQRLNTAFSAKAWNRAQDAADLVLGGALGPTAEAQPGVSAPYSWVYAKNTTGQSVPRWGVMKIDGVQITPTSSADDRATTQFESMPVLTGVSTTSTSASATEACVAVEPIANDAIGRVAVSGVVQVRATDADKVTSAIVLWKNSDWALVRFGGSSIRLGTIGTTWAKGTSATVTQQNGDGTAMTGSPTFAARNHFATVSVTSGTRRVACGQIGSTWILIAADCGDCA